MKELTIEQKAKAYDEASKWMEGIYPTLTHEQQMEAEAFFQIFKESEDEKIKQKIIKLVKMSNKVGGFALHKWEADEMIAWLEKQGEQILANSAKTCKDEQKPAENVEPKFQNGQWIVWQNKCYKVNDNGCGYELIDYNGLSTSLEYGTIDESAHLWDIGKDAKDGDVLVSNRSIFIFSQEYMAGKPKAHCGIMNSLFIVKPEGCWTNEKCYPATKEQRNTLIKAMADAGWEFDFEKKVLKKIENEIEIPFGATDSELHEVTYFIPKGFHAEIDDDKVVIKKGEKSTSWSVEDALRLEEVICMTEANGRWVRSDDAVKSVLDWLKSLKDRYTWKPSEEQMNALASACNGKTLYLGYLNSLYQDLKKL